MFKSSIIVMIINMISRIFGLVREIIIASFFGASGLTDAYFASARISNFFTTILGEGSLGTVFIPIYNEIDEKYNKDKANEFALSIMNLITSITFTFSLIMMLFSKFILKYFIGFNDIYRLELASNLLRIMSFYLFFISISGIMSSLLNSYNKFYISSLVGIVFNLTIIVGVILLNHTYGIYALGISFLLSGLFQVLIQVPSFMKIIKKYKFILDFKSEYIKEFFILMIPTLLGIFAYQINELIDTSFAARLKIGTISAINYASRLYLLPIGVFAISLSVVIFPNLSKSVAKNDKNLFKNTIERGLNLLAILIIPSSLGLYYYSKEIVFLIYHNGKFNTDNLVITSEILQIYSLGLLFFSTIHLLSRSHYALKDRKLPFISSLVSIIINIFLDYMLYEKYKHKGLIFATSFSAIINYLILLISLRIRYSKINIFKYIKFISLSLLNSIFCIYILEKLIFIENKRLEIVLKLFLFIIIYFSIYFLKYFKDKNKFLDK